MRSRQFSQLEEAIGDLKSGALKSDTQLAIMAADMKEIKELLKKAIVQPKMRQKGSTDADDGAVNVSVSKSAMKSGPEDELLSTVAVAEITGIPRRTLARMAATSQIEARKAVGPGGRVSWMFPRHTVHQLIANDRRRKRHAK